MLFKYGNLPYQLDLSLSLSSLTHTNTQIKVRWEGDFASTSDVNRLGHKYLLVPDWNSLVQRANSHQQHLVDAAREQFAVRMSHGHVCSLPSGVAV